jgi:hypothetical protein
MRTDLKDRPLKKTWTLPIVNKDKDTRTPIKKKKNVDGIFILYLIYSNMYRKKTWYKRFEKKKSSYK